MDSYVFREYCLTLISMGWLFQRYGPEQYGPFDILLHTMSLQGHAIKRSTSPVKAAFGNPSLPSAGSSSEVSRSGSSAAKGKLCWVVCCGFVANPPLKKVHALKSQMSQHQSNNSGLLQCHFSHLKMGNCMKCESNLLPSGC